MEPLKVDINKLDYTRFNHQVEKTQTAGKLLNYYGDLIQRIEYAVKNESCAKDIAHRVSDVPVFKNLVYNKVYTNIFNIKLNNIHKLAEEFQAGIVYLEKLTMSNRSKWLKKHFKDEIKMFATTYKEVAIKSYFDLKDKNNPMKYDIIFNFNGVNPSNQAKFQEINRLTQLKVNETGVMEAIQNFINITESPDIKIISKAQLLDLIEEGVGKIKLFSNAGVYNPNYYLDDYYAMDSHEGISEDEALKDIQDTINYVINLRYPIKVYRGVNTRGTSTNENYDNKSWTPSKIVAESFGDVVYVAMIPDQSSVDIEQTIRTRVMNEMEDEIYISDATKINIIASYQTQIKEQKSISKSKLINLVNEEFLGKLELGNGIDLEIYKNPKSIKNFEKNIRAISDHEGNLFVPDMAGSIIHLNLYHWLARNGYISWYGDEDNRRPYALMYSLENVVFWAREGVTNTFKLGESYDITILDDPENIRKLTVLVKKVKQKNPQYEFVIERIR